jgi:GrpB-like predicted nucleotidyltransferase (UPF0157 family)
MPKRIEIMDPRDEWSGEFRTLARPLRSALGDLALRIDHIGSTAVPGLPAKDVIDIQVTVAELNREVIARALAPLGYSTRADVVSDHVPPGADASPNLWRKLYFRAPQAQRATHLHVRQDGLPNQRYALLFRDYLRQYPAAADAYAHIKLALARLRPTDVEAYYDVKDPVCDLIVQAAEQWAATSAWEPGASDA